MIRDGSQGCRSQGVWISGDIDLMGCAGECAECDKGALGRAS